MITDKQHKFLKENFNPDGTQKCLITMKTRTMRGDYRTSQDGSAVYKLVEAGVLKRAEDFKYQRRVYDRAKRETKTVDATAPGFVVVEEHLGLLAAPLAASLTKNMVVILDFIEEHGGGPLATSDIAEKYDYKTRTRTKNTGLGAPSVKSNCEKLVEMGLLSKGKQGRSFVWTRTDAPRPDTAEERKAKVDAQLLEAERKAGKVHVCQGCLRHIQVHQNGKTLSRHGWNLVSFDGGRYGYHTNGCEGWGRAPLEHACDLAIAMVRRFADWLDHVEKNIAKLATRPPLSLTRGEWECLSRKADNYEDVVTIKDGDVVHKRNRHYEYEVNTYDKVLEKRRREAEGKRTEIVGILKAFADAIEKFHKGDAKADAAVDFARRRAAGEVIEPEATAPVDFRGATVEYDGVVLTVSHQ